MVSGTADASNIQKPAGCIYVLTNPDFSDRVKIGFAEDMETALESFNAAVPAPYEVFCTCAVPEPLEAVQVRKIFADGISNVGEAEISASGFCKASPDAALHVLQEYAKAQGLPSGAVKSVYDMKPSVGCIYVLENPLFSEYVKIGYTQNLKNRLKSLNTAVPLPFRVHCTCKVREKLADKDVHGIIDRFNPDLHVEANGGTEFYRISAHTAEGLLDTYVDLKKFPANWLCRWPESDKDPDYAWLLEDCSSFSEEPEDKPAPPEPAVPLKDACPVSKCSPQALGLLFELRKRLCSESGVETDESRWPYGISFRKNGEECLSVVLMQDGISVVAYGAVPQWKPLPASAGRKGVLLRLSGEKELDGAMSAVRQALGLSPAEAPAEAAPGPAKAEETAPADVLQEQSSFADPCEALKERLLSKSKAAVHFSPVQFGQEAEAGLEAFLAANPDAFRDRTVMLFRASPDWPDLVRFFAERFETLGLKRMTAVETAEDGSGKLFLLCRDVTGDGRINIEDLEFNRIPQAGYDSDTVKRFRGQADAVVAAPPPGQATKFAEWAAGARQGFLALGGRDSTGELADVQAEGAVPGSGGGACWLCTDSLQSVEAPAMAPAGSAEACVLKYEAVEREMDVYLEWNPDVFRGKTVLLPCDDPDWSPFTKFFASNFDRLGLKKLISTCYAGSAGMKTATALEKTPLFNPGNSPKGKLFVMERAAAGGGGGNELRCYLKGDGDFRSPEVCRLRDEADIVATAPPSNLFSEFMSWIQAGGKQFIAAGSQNAGESGEASPLLKEGGIWPGGTAPAKGMRWFTNIDHFCRRMQSAAPIEADGEDEGLHPGM